MKNLFSKSNTNSGALRFGRRNGVALVFTALFAGLGALLLLNSQAATGSLNLLPSKSSVIVGNTIDIKVSLTPGTNVNGVEAYLTYDPAVLQFDSIDASTSPFEVALGSQGGSNGSIQIIRGSLDGDVSTTATVATVRFTALTASSSTLIGLTGNATSNGSYTDPVTNGAEVIILADNIGNLYIDPSAKDAFINENFTVNVRLTPETTVNGVEATLTYDSSKMQFVNINATESPFDIALGEQTGGSGTVTIIRGNLGGGVSTDALVAAVTFKALVGSGTSTIQTTGNATKDGYYTHPTTENSTITFKIPDTTPPSVNISSPANGSTVLDQITVSASASDNIGVTKVELYVDGALKDTDNTAPYNFSLDTTTLSNASHSLQAKAYDAAGNVGNSSLINVTVKNWPEDINQDGVVNLLDFSLLATNYGLSGSGLGRTDINQDGVVNLLDFSLLAAKFGQ